MLAAEREYLRSFETTESLSAALQALENEISTDQEELAALQGRADRLTLQTAMDFVEHETRALAALETKIVVLQDGIRESVRVYRKAKQELDRETERKTRERLLAAVSAKKKAYVQLEKSLVQQVQNNASPIDMVFRAFSALLEGMDVLEEAVEACRAAHLSVMDLNEVNTTSTQVKNRTKVNLDKLVSWSSALYGQLLGSGDLSNQLLMLTCTDRILETGHPATPDAMTHLVAQFEEMQAIFIYKAHFSKLLRETKNTVRGASMVLMQAQAAFQKVLGEFEPTYPADHHLTSTFNVFFGLLKRGLYQHVCNEQLCRDLNTQNRMSVFLSEVAQFYTSLTDCLAARFAFDPTDFDLSLFSDLDDHFNDFQLLDVKKSLQRLHACAQPTQDNRRLLVVSDTFVEKHFSDSLLKSLTAAGANSLLFPELPAQFTIYTFILDWTLEMDRFTKDKFSNSKLGLAFLSVYYQHCLNLLLESQVRRPFSASKLAHHAHTIEEHSASMVQYNSLMFFYHYAAHLHIFLNTEFVLFRDASSKAGADGLCRLGLLETVKQEAKAIHQKEIRHHETALRHAYLKKITGYRDIEQPGKYGQTRDILAQVCLYIEQVAAAWTVLPKIPACLSIGHLMDACYGYLIQLAVDSEEIGDAESRHMALLFEYVTGQFEKIAETIKLQMDITNQVRPNSDNRERQSFLYGISVQAKKFADLTYILKSNLAGIVARWQQRALLFTAQDCRKLIASLFESNPERKEALMKIV